MNRREFMEAAATVAAGAMYTQPVYGARSDRPAESEASAMPKRILGNTGVNVSILALGGVIGMQLPPSDDHDPAAIAEAALDLGITYFDTAPSYNSGQSETNYGQVLSRRRKEVFLACKTGDRSYDGTMRSVEQSLKRLRTDRLDLLQIHGVSAGEDLAAWGKPNGVFSALQKLREQKVTRFIGVTGHDSAEILRRAIRTYEFDTLLTTLNPVGRRRPYREDLLRVANDKRMGVIAMKVMGGGNGCLVVGNPYKKVLRQYHDQASQQVKARKLIRYTLGLPVSVAVIGVANVDQLKANVTVAKKARPMNAAEQGELEKHMA
ncbi:MAG: aldo/keto reductase [Planctomycetota bacterium]|jgi:aryl-alcohol dehydrogenase-like predicted oxidoreductase